MELHQDQIEGQVKKELKIALAYFVERQNLVAQAMTELGLDLNEVAEFKSAVWSSGANSNKDDTQNSIASLEPENAYVKKLFQVAKRASERNLSQSGIWRDSEDNEWRYFLHGGGCRLTNTKTGEPIDWDCPDVNSFDRYKFFYHLEWQLSSSERAGNLNLSRKLEKDALRSLINEITL